jgi:deoxyribose-phosphate aldolase
MDRKQLAGMIDHTYLKVEGTRRNIEKICNEAAEYGFASVAINPKFIQYARSLLRGTNVKVDAAVGFFLGMYPLETKDFELMDAARNGAEELDLVMSVGEAKARDWEYIGKEMKMLANYNKYVYATKIILETGLLNDEEIIRCCVLAREAGVTFVKTSTGFGPKGGATVPAVKLMRKTVGPSMGVKAAGGIRTAGDAAAMIKAGANRLGTSAGVQIIKDYSEELFGQL